MAEVIFKKGLLSGEEQKHITAGFEKYAKDINAPSYNKKRVNWLISDNDIILSVLTADILWDWLYIDELWTDEKHRGQGFGKALIIEAESFATSNHLSGLWLWTQSWQAEGFYNQLGYEEFVRFPDFPKGHNRIGFKKIIL